MTNGNNEDDLILHTTRVYASEDPAYNTLHQLVSQGFPNDRNRVPDSAKPYFNVRESLSTENELVLYNGRIVIPGKQRAEVLRELHAAH